MKKVFLTVMFAAVLSACETGGGVKPDDEVVLGDDETSGVASNGENGAGTETFGGFDNGGLDEGTETFSLSDCEPECEYPAEALNDPNTLLATRLVYFDFDSDKVRDEFSDVLVAHAKYLANNPNVRVRLEGHTDERGTREYNLALSEKRAQSVRRYLMLYGARSESVGVYGFGEELPLALGSNESAWSENRRVELVYDTNN